VSSFGQHVTVLGLRQQVRRDESRVGRLVRHHGDFARSRQLVNRARAHHLALGLDDKRVARTEYLADARDAVGAVRQRGDGLRAPNLVNLGRTRRAQRVDQRLVDRRRRGHDDFAHTRLPGQRHGHQRRRDQRCRASRNVNADAVERVKLLTHARAFAVGPRPVARFLQLGKAAHVLERVIDRRHDRRHRLRRARGQQESASDQVNTVEFLREFDQRVVAFLAHGGDEFRHRRLARRGRLRVAVKRGNLLRELRLVVAENAPGLGGHA
jgi:hypothetical protein